MKHITMALLQLWLSPNWAVSTFSQDAAPGLGLGLRDMIGREHTPLPTVRKRDAESPLGTGIRRLVPQQYSTIQLAIDACSNGDTVLVSDGTYLENIRYRGKAIIVASYYLIDADSSHIDQAIIDGSQPSSPDSGSVVSFVSGEDTTSVLCGFTIRGGTGTSLDDGSRRGGGILAWNSGAKIVSNRITRNVVIGPQYVRGGGIHAGGNAVIIAQCLIDSNRATAISDWAVGGGISLWDNACIIGNRIQDNVVSYEGSGTDIGATGSGIRVGNSPGLPVVISGNAIVNNVSVSISQDGFGTYAAGVDIIDGEYELTGNLIEGNVVSSPVGGYGPGIRVVYGHGTIAENEFLFNQGIGNPYINGGAVLLGLTNDVNITRNRFEGNSGSWGGGILDYQTIGTTIAENTFAGNSAAFWGGAIDNQSDASIINNLIVGNSAGWGGALHVYTPATGAELEDEPMRSRGGSIAAATDAERANAAERGGHRFTKQLVSAPRVINNTIAFNTATTGGGIRTINSQPIILNSILWGNSSGQIALVSGSIEVRYSNIQGGWPGTGNISVDPMFVGNEYKLQVASPCIGTGADSVDIAGTWHRAPRWDLGGFPRPMPTGTQPDMGAWEEQTVIVGVDNDQSIPLTYSLSQNYPNPFNPSTSIRFTVVGSGLVTLKVYNLLGQEVATLVNAEMGPGHYEATWDVRQAAGGLATGISSGVYFYRLTAGTFSAMNKMIVTK